MTEQKSQDQTPSTGALAKREAHKKQPQPKPSKAADVLKLLIAVAFIAGGMWAYYALSHLANYVRALLPAVGVLLALLIIFFWCDFGRRLIAYVRASFVEFRKVVWPPRDDALRMTMFVVVFVAILSLFIYGVDSFISWLFFDVLLKRG